MAEGISRKLIKEVGDQPDRFAFGKIATRVAAECFDTADTDVEAMGAYVKVSTVLENEYVGKKAIPANLADDQIEDWVRGQAVIAGLQARSAQNKWDEVYGGWL